MSQEDCETLFATAFYDFFENLYRQHYPQVLIVRKERPEFTYLVGDELEKHVSRIFLEIIQTRRNNGILVHVNGQPVADENSFREFIKLNIFDIPDNPSFLWVFIFHCCHIAAVSVECELRGVNNTSELSIEIIAKAIKFYNCKEPFRRLGFWHGMNMEAYVKNYALKIKKNTEE